MKRFPVAIATFAVILAGAGVAAAAGVGTPEIDEANATLQVKPTAQFTASHCDGEDGITYVTYRGNWAGSETDVTPGSTDYNLSGSLSVTGIVWTVNQKTQRGVLRGTAGLVTQSAAGGTSRTYLGPIVLVTQGVPAGANGLSDARGWINAATYTAAKPDGGSLLANVEFTIGSSFAASGEFGGSKGYADFSVADNNLVCPAVP